MRMIQGLVNIWDQSSYKFDLAEKYSELWKVYKRSLTLHWEVREGYPSLASELSIYRHDHRKEDHQAKKNHEEPAHVSPDFSLALCAFLLGFHLYSPFLKFWWINKAAVFVLPHHRWKQKCANDQGCKLSLTIMMQENFHVSTFFKTAFASYMSPLNSCISVFWDCKDRKENQKWIKPILGISEVISVSTLTNAFRIRRDKKRGKKVVIVNFSLDPPVRKDRM